MYSKLSLTPAAHGVLALAFAASLCLGCSDNDGNRGTEKPATSWIAGGWVETADAWYGILSVVDDLSSDNTLDLASAVSFDGDITYSGYGKAVYVGQEAKATIEKWAVDGAGLLQKQEQVSFEAYGVKETFGASHHVIQIIDDETGWFFDHTNGRVLVFNPTTMRTDGTTIDYSAIYDGLDLEAGDWPDIGDTGRVGDYIAAPMFWYSGADDTIPVETRVALVNTKDRSVSIAVDRRCAGSNEISNDGEGNIYFGPHAAAALYSAAGDAGAAVPCVIRIKHGEDVVDQDYLIEFPDLTDKAVGGIYQGPGNSAYVFQFEGDPTIGAKARFSDEWNLYRVELGAKDPKYTLVDGWPAGNGVARAFNVMVESERKYFITSTTKGGAKSNYYELKADGTVEKGLNIPTFPGPAVNH